MKTDVITVSAKGKQMEKALEQVEKVAAYKGLSPKDTLHLRLLTEEMMGMMRSITGEPEGEFWIEDNDGEYALHLRVAARMSLEKRAQLLSVSASGKNEAARGLMGRIREFFDMGCDEDYDGFSTALMPDAFEHSSSPVLDWEWSMRRYENVVSAKMGQDDAAREAWDELEKSVVKHVADDVKVFIRGGYVEMTILKKMA
ncbi:MAG: hypothetical protein K6F61_07980 [Clostridiales bacterium]|nr:hypothetical protein [Clostridiales bacterium]